MATTPPPPSAGGVAHLNELLFEALDDEPFVSGLTPVTGELAADAAAAVRAEARHIDHTFLPPPALEQLVQEQHQQLQRSDSSPQPRQLQPPQRAASRGEQRSGSTSSRGNSGESRRGPGRGEMAARKPKKLLR